MQFFQSHCVVDKVDVSSLTITLPKVSSYLRPHIRTYHDGHACEELFLLQRLFARIIILPGGC